MSNDVAALAALLASGDKTNFRLRQGEITAVASDGTCTVAIAGDTDNPISEVNYASTVCPVPGAGCWIATDGDDLFVVATIAPAGPGFVHAYRTTDQTIGNSSWTALSWSSLVTPSQYGGSFSTSGITVAVPGLWNVEAAMAFASPGGAGNFRTSRLTVNGTVVYGGVTVPGSAAVAGRMQIGVTLKLAIGDVINVEVWQNNGGNLALVGGADTFALRSTWVGPAV